MPIDVTTSHEKTGNERGNQGREREGRQRRGCRILLGDARHMRHRGGVAQPLGQVEGLREHPDHRAVRHHHPSQGRQARGGSHHQRAQPEDHPNSRHLRDDDPGQVGDLVVGSSDLSAECQSDSAQGQESRGDP
ncbi:hypothetical protein [Actinomyces slackii]|uniref:hypothetical protein n=1 Tax=Actinomyces slackii TaxID=52774 RepID=UPI000F81BD4B|nr:hypothetical protein [Actinomyces slackii]